MITRPPPDPPAQSRPVRSEAKGRQKRSSADTPHRAHKMSPVVTLFCPGSAPDEGAEDRWSSSSGTGKQPDRSRSSSSSSTSSSNRSGSVETVHEGSALLPVPSARPESAGDEEAGVWTDRGPAPDLGDGGNPFDKGCWNNYCRLYVSSPPSGTTSNLV